MNHFMARLIFCFFAESTDIFFDAGQFTATIDRMSARDASNTHEVIGTIFRAMNTRTNERAAWNCPRWADGSFPYVNGGLFSGTLDAPRFTRIARSYLIHVGGLDWQKINPDIFGSMIQAVADDEERGALGMHYTQIYGSNTVITDLAFVVYPMDLVTFSVISSALHLIWVKTVAGGMRDGLRYSSQLAYHTFPLPQLTQKSRMDLIGCAENILLIREAHFPKTIADLYDRETMPDDLRAAHERNDEVLERIYIGRRFKNDTERLEKLFDLYSKMIAAEGGKAAKGKATNKVKAVS
jgi:hypothetical protein